jgi:hypothetical protein
MEADVTAQGELEANHLVPGFDHAVVRAGT